jgi:hypothetical protein
MPLLAKPRHTVAHAAISARFATQGLGQPGLSFSCLRGARSVISMLNTRTVWNGDFGSVVAAFLGAAPLLSDSGALVALT